MDEAQSKAGVLAVYPNAKAVTPSYEDNWSIVADKGHARMFLSVSVVDDKLKSEGAAWMVAYWNLLRHHRSLPTLKGEDEPKRNVCDKCHCGECGSFGVKRQCGR